MATRAELDKINAAIANLATQVSAVADNIKAGSQAAQAAHDADDDAALETAVTNLNSQADALKALVQPVAQTAAAATPSA